MPKTLTKSIYCSIKYDFLYSINYHLFISDLLLLVLLFDIINLLLHLLLPASEHVLVHLLFPLFLSDA